MIQLKNIEYKQNNYDLLFDNINLTVNQNEKSALIGDNGVGKSTLLQIIAGILKPSAGSVYTTSVPYYIPQLYGQYNDYSIAEALHINKKLNALHEILDGNSTEENFTQLNDDWNIEERCRDALLYWGLEHLELNQKLETLSGGQKTKILLAGININQAGIVLMDEPSNHLDIEGRELLYNFISSFNGILLIVSHDRTLLNRLDIIYELDNQGISKYGGNYDFYKKQKEIEISALSSQLKNQEKELRKAKKIEREVIEQRNKMMIRGKKQQTKQGTGSAMMDKMKNDAENTAAQFKNVHTDKISSISQTISELKQSIPNQNVIKFGFDNSNLHKGKTLITAKNINFKYNQQNFYQSNIWKQPINFQIVSGDRVAILGANASGKTTLIKLMLKELFPTEGILITAANRAIYIDQDYSLIDNSLSVLEQAQCFNELSLEDHEIKIRLNRFLFPKDDWTKLCAVLSGGEKMRLMLCLLTIAKTMPDIIILDEPTNNLDIKSLEIMTSAINEYQGTLLVISHDRYFLEQISINMEIVL